MRGGTARSPTVNRALANQHVSPRATGTDRVPKLMFHVARTMHGRERVIVATTQVNAVMAVICKSVG